MPNLLRYTYPMLHEQIKNQIKEAMLAKDAARLQTLRGLVSAFTNELVAKKRKPQESLTDEEALAVISRAVKQRKDSIEQFEKGGRSDLAEDEKAELAILLTYLPAQMSREEVMGAVKAKQLELGVTDKAMTGKLMGVMMKDLKGKTDGDVVKSVIDEIFG